jgi:ATP-dependent DNA helicase RecG
MERLKVLEESNDGFHIANEDLRLRGPGDFFGIRQSGEAIFKIADIYNHNDSLKKAQEVWQKYGSRLLDNVDTINGVFRAGDYGGETVL